MDWAKDRDHQGLLSIGNAKRLFELGLIRRIDREWSRAPVIILTSDGLVAARMLLASEVSKDAPVNVGEMRERLRDYVSQRDAAMTEMREQIDDIPVES